MQVPEELREASEALARATAEVNDYNEDTSITRYKGPQEYEPQGHQRAEKLREDRARQQAEKERKAAEAREKSELRRSMAKAASAARSAGRPGSTGTDADADARQKAAEAAERRARLCSEGQGSQEFGIFLDEGKSDSELEAGAFMLHNRATDGPLDQPSPSLEMPARKTPAGRSRHIINDDGTDDSAAEDVQCTKEVEALDIDSEPWQDTIGASPPQGNDLAAAAANLGSAAPAASQGVETPAARSGNAGETGPGRGGTGMLEERQETYREHYRLHIRYSSEPEEKVVAVVVTDIRTAQNQDFSTVEQAREWVNLNETTASLLAHAPGQPLSSMRKRGLPSPRTLSDLCLSGGSYPCIRSPIER